MVRNLIKTCEVCLKSMRGDVLKGHMKQHDEKEEMKVDKNTANCEICMKTMRKDHLKRHMKKHENKNNKDKKRMLLNDIVEEMQEFNRKKEMGRKTKEEKTIQNGGGGEKQKEGNEAGLSNKK